MPRFHSQDEVVRRKNLLIELAAKKLPFHEMASIIGSSPYTIERWLIEDGDLYRRYCEADFEDESFGRKISAHIERVRTIRSGRRDRK